MNEQPKKRSRPSRRQASRGVGSEAARRAAAILEVLAGVRTAQQAAGVLKISTNHYYLLERKALAGLAAACEPQPRGKRPDAEKELASLRRALQRCQQECQRQAALVRAMQRTVGLPPPPAPQQKPAANGKAGKKKSARRRRRAASVRALRAARDFQQQAGCGPETPPEPAGAGSGPPSTKERQDAT